MDAALRGAQQSIAGDPAESREARTLARGSITRSLVGALCDGVGIAVAARYVDPRLPRRTRSLRAINCQLDGSQGVVGLASPAVLASTGKRYVVARAVPIARALTRVVAIVRRLA